jgi:transposase InsO family protein
LQAIPSAQAQEYSRLKVLIIAAHQQNRETYGTRRVKHELAAQGHDVGRDRIGWLRRELELRCKQRRKSVPRPTQARSSGGR